MNDQELLEILEQKAPRDLTIEEINLLKERVPQSEELRQAIEQHVQLEECLIEALGRIDVKVDEILDRARDQKKGGIGTAYWLLLLFLLIAVGSGTYVAMGGPGSEQVKKQLASILPSQGPDDIPPKDDPESPPADDPSSDPTDPSPTDPDKLPPHKIESLPLEIEAAHFTGGNVTSENVDDPDFVAGKYLSVVVNDFFAPEDAEYRLRLRIDAMESRPMQILINGQRQQDPVTDKQSRDPNAKNWYNVGVYHFDKGINTVRLEAKQGMPHITALALDDPSRVHVAPPETPVPGPWDGDLAADPIPFEEACFGYFDVKKHRPMEEELREWFEATPGQRFRITKHQVSGSEQGIVEGVARLKAPWPKDAVLRVAFDDMKSLQFHLYHKEQGLTIASTNDYGWAAYVTQRESGKALPKHRYLVAQDQRRTATSELLKAYPLELRYVNGEILLSRGDILLLAAPLDGPPEDIFFEGRFAVRGIRMYRGNGHPALPQPWKIVQQVDRPADLKWQQKLPENDSMTSADDGSVTLHSKEGSTQGFIFAKLSTPSWGVVDVLVDGYVPGTGVHLHPSIIIDGSGKRVEYDGIPPNTLGVMIDRKTKSIGMQWQPIHYGSHDMEFRTFNEAAVPYVGKQTWLRFFHRGKRVEAFASPNGRHWGRIETYQTLGLGVYDQIGLSIRPNAKNAQITLRKIVVRVPPILSSIADSELLEKVPTFEGVTTFTGWLAEVFSSQPENVELGAWRRVCALRCIYEGHPEQIRTQLNFALGNDEAFREWPLERRIALQNEITSLNPPAADQWTATVEHYKELVTTADALHPFSRSRSAIMGMPSTGNGAALALNKAFLRKEILSAIYSARWDDLASALKQAVFFERSSIKNMLQRDSLLPWASALAAKHRPGIFGSSPPLLKLTWRHPYVEEYSKEAYNVLAEFQSALDGKQYEDACRIVAAIDPVSTKGLLPAVNDKQHLVSLQTAIGIAMDTDPLLHAAMVQQFGPLSQLRVKQAIAAGEAESVELATIQFNGTPAAAQAHAWLGDRSLAVGQFALAISHYRRAEESALASLKRELAPRVRLAAAMLGQELGKPITYSVQLGDASMSADEFEKLVKDMIKHRAGNAPLLDLAAVTSRKQQVPAATGFVANRKSTLDGAAGDQLSSLPPEIRLGRVDWAARQLETVREDNILYVSNRYQISAFDLNNGSRKWRCETLSGRSLGRAHDLSSISMRPVIVGDRIFVRQHERRGAVLVSVDKPSGKLLWVADIRHNEDLISDPMWAKGRIVALAALRTDQDEIVLKLNHFSPEDGELLQSQQLVRLRGSWRDRQYCRTTTLDDGFLADLGGVVMNCDFHGQVRWARKQNIVPYEIQEQRHLQSADRPLVLGKVAFLATPASGVIECVEVQSGKLHWRQVVRDVRCVLGIHGDRVLLSHAKELSAFAITDGSRLWSQPIGPLMNAQVCADGDELMVCREAPVTGRNDQFCPQLVWLDATSGKETANWTFESLAASHPRFGPLIQHKDKLWAFAYGREDSGNRDFYELIAKDKADKPFNHQILGSDSWLKSHPETLRQAIAKVLPNWQAISCDPNPDRLGALDIHGKKGVVGTRSTPTAPVVLGRKIAFPKGQKPKLKIEVGNEPNQNWKLEVVFRGKVVATKDFEHSKSPGVWESFTIPLEDVGGKEGYLLLRASSPSANLYWQKIEIVF